ncbi:MAG: cysteine dioxygenase family protein [Phycisphaerae bacterium]|jgi:cysteine dioxygenase|nr:cysteine dioxygenase family protein [Phycisphaerae bacterium]MCZ2398726.1 cysteine dioxygenase family protein [Phycisphaerae bacterium]NUQ50700.1 cysteine dioxygenase family protein [Phycisphaerae bacterium]
MSPVLHDLFAALDQQGECIPLDFLRRMLEEAPLSLEDLAPWLRFGRESYQRNLIHQGPGYHALALCWRSGQRSPIHDHRGSACGLRVVSGVMSETVFDRTPEGHIYPTHTHVVRAGQVCATYDMDIHQVSNLQPPGRDLVTLHIYSPPLLVMGTYSLFDLARAEYADPVFADGAGI